jgi:hypothetical protein
LFCDIDERGVRYCAEAFAGSGIVSRPELTVVDLPHDLDLIWVGSLFTHVDQDRCARWLAFLAEHLRADGLLVATFHGLWSTRVQVAYPMIDARGWETIMRGYRDVGFGYARYQDSGLDDYGISLATPSAVLRMATAIPGTRVVSYSERGWADNQDVLAVTRLVASSEAGHTR